MAEYIEREKAIEICQSYYEHCLEMHDYCGDSVAYDIRTNIQGLPIADVVPVVRCKDCEHSRELEKNCEINNREHYRHCAMYRGEEERVWVKYKRYHKDYSIVELDDYCSYGERRGSDEKL